MANLITAVYSPYLTPQWYKSSSMSCSLLPYLNHVKFPWELQSNDDFMRQTTIFQVTEVKLYEFDAAFNP